MIKGHYPLEIQRYLEQEIREAAKPQPNLEIEHFLIKTYRKTDKLIEDYKAESNARVKKYKAKMAELEALRTETEERRLKTDREYHQEQINKPTINPVIRKSGFLAATMDLFFNKRKE